MGRLLLQHGANPNSHDFVFGTALRAATSGLPKDGPNKAAIDLLLDAGTDIDHQSESNATALHEAARRGNLDIIEVLLDRGANVNAKHQCYGTALQAAMDKKHYKAARLLIERGALDNEGQKVVGLGPPSDMPIFSGEDSQFTSYTSLSLRDFGRTKLTDYFHEAKKI